jgi:hypothetical protein
MAQIDIIIAEITGRPTVFHLPRTLHNGVSWFSRRNTVQTWIMIMITLEMEMGLGMDNRY